MFCLCIADGTSFKDLDLTVSFKAVAGKLDQGGGPVWRYQDADNYYIARMNPLENNYRVYKVVNGKRTQLGSADVKSPAGEWHTLRVVHRDDQIRCYLGDEHHRDAKDGTTLDASKWDTTEYKRRDGYGKDHRSKGMVVKVPGVMEGFHTFGLWWKPDKFLVAYVRMYDLVKEK